MPLRNADALRFLRTYIRIAHTGTLLDFVYDNDSKVCIVPTQRAGGTLVLASFAVESGDYVELTRVSCGVADDCLLTDTTLTHWKCMW